LGKGTRRRKREKRRGREGEDEGEKRGRLGFAARSGLLENAAFEDLSFWEECGRCWD
jgi:hypothetical protein